ACAGPGGKSAYLSDKFKSVVACELHQHRADLIKAYVERMNKTNVNIVCADSTKFDPRFENRFDRVLCDVPCSGYGTIKSNPDIKLNRGEQAFLELNKTQFEILSNCARYVKVGGAIVYSTCSVFDDENDLIVERFLNANDGFKVEKIESPLYSVQKKYGLQFLPQLSFGAGFYCARLLRVK
ncbi:MAG: RsmB/NOP family class I SAM-dependent RNA methyltransferase, partial [Clostridia bacterium]|nr:RsmB/NOP family class I SAM-dependent RNA methyltransferase [Clostridia bacterium]